MKTIKFLLISLLFLIASGEERPEGVSLYPDAYIERIAKRFLRADLAKKGDLKRLSKENNMNVGGAEWNANKDILGILGLDEKKVSEIEGIGVNAWSITRFQVSPSFDLFVECRLVHYDNDINVKIRSLFFAPHKEAKYDALLFSSRRWTEIKFE